MPQEEFYQLYNLPKEYGFTPSIVNMLGGVSMIDSYTPASAARNTIGSYQDYLKTNVGTSKARIVDYLYRVADKYGINRDVAYKQIDRESNFDPQAKSRAGAVGVAQFMPATAKQYGLQDRTDPYASIDAWGRYMRDLLEMQGGDYSKALASYNWGQGNVFAAIKNYGASWLSNAPRETRDYVAAILGNEVQGDGWQTKEIWVDGSGNIVEPGTPGATKSTVRVKDAGIAAAAGSLLSGQLEDFLTGDVAKDAGKRLALVLVAIVLIAVAVVSLR